MPAPATSLTSLPDAPAGPVDSDGRLRAGAFAGEVPDLEQVTRAARLAGVQLAPMRLKRWIYVWVGDARVMAGLAIADVGYLGQVFAYVYDRERGAAPVEIEWQAPAAMGCRVGGGLAGVAALGRSVKKLVEVRAEGVGLRASFDLATPAIALAERLGAERHRLRGSIRVERLDTPLTVLSDLGDRCPGATVKAAGVPASGEVEVDGRRFELRDAFATVDWTYAYFPYRTDWNWTSAAGRDRGGRPVGLNLCRGVHDRGAHTENALWLDGRPAAVAPVRYEVGNAPAKPWRIASDDGAVDLEFRPLGERRADIDYGLVASRFRQPFGTFHGRVRDRDGRACELDGTPGVCEDHHARW